MSKEKEDKKELTKEEKKLEKRRKGVETIFDMMFMMFIIMVIIEWILGEIDFSTTRGIILAIYLTGATVLTFIAARLAHHGKISAGVIGIIVGCIAILSRGILDIIAGVLLLIDSVLFIINYENAKGKNKE